MSSEPWPLPGFPGITLPPAYAGSIGRYRLIAVSPEVVVDNTTRYNKRFKSTHRTEIIDTRGPLTLTVPLQGGHYTTWAEAVVSDHGNWHQNHLTALASAYGRTPFFEFYIDRIEPVITAAVAGSRLVDLDSALERTICRLLQIPEPRYVEDGDMTGTDMRHILPESPNRQYWQIRADRLGFHPGLSILDLLFNLGPEAPLYLYRTSIKPD